MQRIEASPTESNTASSELGISPAAGCLLSLFLGMTMVALFYLALTLAMRGELHLQRGALGGIRLWLVREEANQGLGISSTRVRSGSESQGQVCLETRVRFLLWQQSEEVDNPRYCECFQQLDERWELVGDCEP